MTTELPTDSGTSITLAGTDPMQEKMEALKRQYELIQIATGKKYPKKHRRGTPGAFGKCHNFPTDAYKSEALRKAKDTLKLQKAVMGEADPKLETAVELAEKAS